MPANHPFARPLMPLLSVNDLDVPASLPGSDIRSLPYLFKPGLTLLTGGPFSGTTLLGFQLLIRVSLGQALITGASEAPSTSCRALYLGLKHSRRILEELCENYRSANPGQLLPDHAVATNTFRPLTPKEGLLDLQTELDEHPELRLIVIDNLTYLRELFKGNDRALFSLLRGISEQRGISILILHNTRGSARLLEYVDQHMHLKRYTHSSYYCLDVLGEAQARTPLELYCSPSGIDFRLTTSEESAALEKHGMQKPLLPSHVTILHLLAAKQGPFTLSQIANALKQHPEIIKIVLAKMCRLKYLSKPMNEHYELSNTIKPLLIPLLAQYNFVINEPFGEMGEPTPEEIKATTRARRDRKKVEQAQVPLADLSDEKTNTQHDKTNTSIESHLKDPLTPQEMAKRRPPKVTHVKSDTKQKKTSRSKRLKSRSNRRLIGQQKHPLRNVS